MRTGKWPQSYASSICQGKIRRNYSCNETDVFYLCCFRGGAPTAQSYDKFSTPSIGSYQAPSGPASGQSSLVSADHIHNQTFWLMSVVL